MFTSIKVDEEGVYVFSPFLGEGAITLPLTKDESVAVVKAFAAPEFWTLFLTSVKASIIED